MEKTPVNVQQPVASVNLEVTETSKIPNKDPKYDLKKVNYSLASDIVTADIVTFPFLVT